MEHLTAHAVLDHLLRGDVERGLDHRGLDEDALTGPVADFERGERGEHGVQCRERVARAAHEHGQAVGIAGEPRHPRDPLHRLREPGAVAPRTVEPERGHARHDDPRVPFVHDVPREAELLHHPWRVVVDERVGGVEQPVEQLDAGL